MTYRNPVLPGFHPDPSVCRVGDEYYLATSSFEYFPGVPLYRSRDLVEWTPIGHCLTRDEQLPLADCRSSGGIFAPTLRHHDGTFYVVTTNVSEGRHFFVTADDPCGEWSDPTWLDAPGIDPDLFWDDDTVYFTYRAGKQGIEQADVCLETGEFDDTRTLCNNWEAAWTEAPHLYEVEGTYYLLLAEGGTHTGHMVVVGRSDDPTGPFEQYPDNPVLTHRDVDQSEYPIRATGHGDLVQATDGSWWLVFLGIRQHGGFPGWHHLGRETFLAPVEWVDGWPVVNDDEPVELEQFVASGLPGEPASADADEPEWATKQPFRIDSLGPAWNHRRNPDPDQYALANEELHLFGSEETLSERGATFVGRRQQHFDCRVQVELAFDPPSGAEAGLTVVQNEAHHYDYAVADRGGDRRRLVRLTVGDVADVVVDEAVPDGPVTLAIDAARDEYRFPGPTVDDGPDPLATASTRYVSTEVAGGFTGVYLGCYATGRGRRCETPARFRSFEYTATDPE